MYLQELFGDLAYGELTQLYITNSPAGGITEADYPKIVSFINLGLIELAKRFNLKLGTLLLHEDSSIFTYYLKKGSDTDFCIEMPDSSIFEDNLIKILQIETSTGQLIPLNDQNYTPTPERISVNTVDYVTVGAFTPSFNTLTLTPFIPVDTLTVTYRAAFKPIVITETFNPKTCELDISPVIKEALLSYVASRFFIGSTSQSVEGQPNPVLTFRQMYETACKKLEMYDLSIEDNGDNNSFERNGWI